MAHTDALQIGKWRGRESEMTPITLTEKEARALGIKKNKVRGTSGGTVHQSNAESDTDEAYDQAVQTLRDLEGIGLSMLFGGDVGIRVFVKGRTEADIDNIFKGVSDALQGVLYADDKQVRKGQFEYRGER